MSSLIKIVLIEDNPGDARLMQEMLAEARGVQFTVEHRTRLSDGLECLAAGEKEIVLLDLGLPDSQGLDTLLRVRKQSSGVPIVVLTGLADEEFALKALHSGADDYLVKGQIDSSLLVRTIRYTIERKHAEEALRISEARFRDLFKQSPLSMQILSPHGRTLEVNHAWEQLWGLTLDMIRHYNILQDKELLAKGIMPFIQKGFSEAATEIPPVLYDPAAIGLPGRARWVKAFIYPVKDETGSIRQVVLMHVDITDLVQAEAALGESEERYRITTESAQDAIISIDEESRIILVNPAAEMLFGYTGNELHGRSLTMLMPERLRQAHLSGVQRHIATGKRHFPWGAVELPGLHKDGREIPLEISYGEFIKDGKRFFIGIARDITERKKAEETIHYQAYHDLLTGLPNRAQLMLKLELELAQADRNQRKLAILHIDIDRFRVINDSLGHSVGDKIIIAFAERLGDLIRKSDTLSHIGSDEFIILLPDLNRPEDAARFARITVEAMRKPFRINGHELYATASIGISMYPEDSKTAEVLLKDADIAVSHVKERGRNHYQFFNPAINVRTIEQLLLESDLRQSLERGELELHYQPQVSIRTGEIIALEALVRWTHPVLGLIGPSQFIPVAEEIGFITAIDEWVLRTACTQNKIWQDTGYPPLCVTVNLSAQQFQQPALVEMVTGILHETGLDPHYLDIEITENTAMRDIDLAVPNLKGLHEAGIDLSIDDFGTGYSSLNYLKRFPVNRLKIDQSFIRGVTTDPDDQAIVSAVIAMGHHLRLRIVAEGVETDGQLSFIQSNNCDEMQGFLFSEPLPPERIKVLLASNP